MILHQTLSGRTDSQPCLPPLERRNAAPERRSAIVRLERRSVSDDGAIEGYGSVFGVLDDWGDIVARGAFAASLADHRAASTMPAMLWQHRDAEPIGVWTDMTEDDKGLRVRGRLVLAAPRGREAYELLKAGALNGLSIGYMPRKWSYDEVADVRTLQEVDLWEVSPVTFPSNSMARVDTVKSASIAAIATIRDAEQALRDAGLPAAQSKAVLASVKRAVTAERDAELAAHALMRAASGLLACVTNASA